MTSRATPRQTVCTAHEPRHRQRQRSPVARRLRSAPDTQATNTTVAHADGPDSSDDRQYSATGPHRRLTDLRGRQRHAIVSFLRYTGVRSRELRALPLARLDLTGGARRGGRQGGASAGRAAARPPCGRAEGPPDRGPPAAARQRPRVRQPSRVRAPSGTPLRAGCAWPRGRAGRARRRRARPALPAQVAAHLRDRARAGRRGHPRGPAAARPPLDPLHRVGYTHLVLDDLRDTVAAGGDDPLPAVVGSPGARGVSTACSAWRRPCCRGCKHPAVPRSRYDRNRPIDITRSGRGAGRAACPAGDRVCRVRSRAAAARRRRWTSTPRSSAASPAADAVGRLDGVAADPAQP